MVLLDYRDRVSVLVWAVLVGLIAQRALTLPQTTLSTAVFGSPVTLTIGGSALLGLLVAGMAASGAEAVIRAHPRTMAGQLGSHWAFWALPIALIVIMNLLLPLAPTRLYWAVGIILSGGMLGLTMAGIYHTIDPFATGYRRARIGLNAITYAIALVLFLVVYRMRVRSIVSATQIMFVSALLAVELLRGSEKPMVLVAWYAGIAGLLLGQATWALNYWRLASITGGLILLLLFYNIIGLSQHALQGRLSRRVLIEFGLITLGTLALIFRFAPRAF